jgi:hypothetical protein
MRSWPTNGSGRVLSSRFSGSPSATKMFQALMIGQNDPNNFRIVSPNELLPR